MKSLNETYSRLSARRRYEVWFIRLGLADESGAWWFRYLLMNPGRSGCAASPAGLPAQVWATWFPRNGEARSFIQDFPLESLDLSARGWSPFHFRVAGNAISEDSCRGSLHVDGHDIAWDLHYSSTFRVTVSNVGWIGFSRTPHSDAIFSGHIALDGQTFQGQPLGFGVQGHNCGYRHRGFWTWTHAYFGRSGAPPSTFEALLYDIPLGMIFRKAVLWHESKRYVFRDLREITRDRNNLQWNCRCCARNGPELEVAIDGGGPGIHRLPYLKTDCSGTFEVVNNSLAKAGICIKRENGSIEQLETSTGAVLEMVGQG